MVEVQRKMQNCMHPVVVGGECFTRRWGTKSEADINGEM